MVVIDGIIYTWHGHGGIGVYWDELYSYFKTKNMEVDFYDYVNSSVKSGAISVKPRYLERYRDFPLPIKNCIFHSSYYRLPVSNNQVKTITTVHDFIYEKVIGGITQKLHSWQKFRAIRGSDAVICVSDNTRQDFMEYFPDFPESNEITVYNGVSDHFKRLDATTISERPERPYVIFVGSRKGYKNFSLAVDAVARTDLDLIIVGGGAFSSDELEQLEVKIKGRYHIAGKVSTPELNLLYNNAFCLLYPSLYEGFGIPVLEAMKAGCPVIAVNISSIPEISGGNALLFDEADPGIITSQLDSLNDLDFRNNLITKGVPWAERFTWRDTAEKTIDVYRKFL